MTDIDALCAEYLGRLDAALRERSIPQRPQIVEQITEHLNEARDELPVQSEAAVRSILERLGRPDDIAAAAATGDGTAAPPRAPWFKRGNRIPVLAVVVVLVALGLTLGLLASSGSTPSRATNGSTHTTTTTLGIAAGTVSVPVVLGESVPQATVTIQAAGLSVQGIYGDPNGTVISQDPSGHSRVATRSQIALHTQSASSAPSAGPNS
jgi:uncharacterized membrane protein